MICIVINSLGRGGAERSILLLAEELLRRGEQVQIVCLFDLPDEYAVKEHMQFCIHRLHARTVWTALLRLRNHFLRCEPSAVFALMPQANMASWLASFGLGLTIITSERTTPNAFYRSRLKLMLSLAPHAFSNRAVFISEHAVFQGLPANALGRAVHRNSSILHNPVASPVPLAQACDTRLARVQRLRSWAQGGASAEDPLRLLLASRLVAGKGVLEFIKASKDLLIQEALELVIAGTGPLQEALHNWVKQNGLSDRVHIHGFVDDIQAAYANADVVILSSESEGFGRVGFEAYQAGCLVLGTHCNSFASELDVPTPAWQVVPSITPLKPALLAFADILVPEGGEDIAAMRAALSVELHAKNFIDIIRSAAPHG